MDRHSLKLYLVTDRRFPRGRSLEEVVREAIRGGVSIVQLREKDIDTAEFVRLGSSLSGLLKPLGIPLIINDRIDIALACGADGVHIGQSDMPYPIARKLLGADKIIGLSVENLDQIKEANRLDVDYIAVSPVFCTPTKTDTAPAFGLEGLKEAVRLSLHPVVGIGGINEENAGEIISCGADGIAVVSAIMDSDNPKEAAETLMRKMI